MERGITEDFSSSMQNLLDLKANARITVVAAPSEDDVADTAKVVATAALSKVSLVTASKKRKILKKKRNFGEIPKLP